MIKSVFITVMCVLAACDSSSFTVGGAKVAGPYTAEPTSMDTSADAIQPETPKFWVAFTTPNAKPGDVIATRLIAVDTGPVKPPNTQIAETSVTVPAGSAGAPASGANGTFNFTPEPPGWVPGKYMVQLTRNGAIMATTTFPILPKQP